MTAVLRATPAQTFDLAKDGDALQQLGAAVGNVNLGGDIAARLVALVDELRPGDALGDVLKILTAGDKTLQSYAALWTSVGDLQGAAPPAGVNPKIVWKGSRSLDPVKPGKSLPFSLDLGASGALTLNAADRDPSGSGKPCISILATGTVSLDAGITAPLPSILTVGADGKADATITMTWYFTAQPTDLFAVALANSLLNLAEPFDFQDCWTMLSARDGVAITYEFDKSATFALSVALAEPFSLANGLVSANLGSSVAVSVNPSSANTLMLSAGQTNGAFTMEATLGRGEQTTGDTETTLGLSLDISKLSGPVTDAMAKLTSQWGAALATIKPWVTPGTALAARADGWLTGKVSGLLGNSGSLRDTALETDLSGLLDASSSTPAGRTTALTNLISAAIDRSGLFSAPTLAVANALAPIKSAAPALYTLAEGDLHEIITSAQAQITAGVQGAVSAAIGNSASSLPGALSQALGANVSGPLTQLDAALAPVNALLSKADTLVQSLSTEIEKALKQKITAQITGSDTYTDGVSVQAKGAFTANGPTAEDAFRALAQADVKALTKYVADGFPAGFEPDTTASAVTRYTKGSTQTGLDVVLFGFELSANASNVFSATIRADEAGNVTCAAEDADTNTFGGRSTTFSNTLAYSIAAAGLAQQAQLPTRSLGLTAGTSLSDPMRKAGALSGFFNSFINGGLLSAGALTKARADFGQWTVSRPAGQALQIVLAANLPIGANDLSTLLQIPNSDTQARRTLAIQTAYNALVAAGGVDAGKFNTFAQDFTSLNGAGSGRPGDVVDAYGDFRASRVGKGDEWLFDTANDENDWLDTDSPDGDYLRDRASYFVQPARMLYYFATLLETLRSIYMATPGGLFPGAATLSAGDYAKSEKLVGECADLWLGNAWLTFTQVTTLAGDNTTIAHPTIAFFRALLTLAGKANTGMTVTMSSPTDNGTHAANFT
jgi:hypothetical protein